MMSFQPKAPSSAVTQFLATSGVGKVIVGHQPHGDAPVIIDNGYVQIITGDTSYAAGVKWGSPDMAREDQIRMEGLQELVRVPSGQTGEGLHFTAPADPNDTRGIAVSEVKLNVSLMCARYWCLTNCLYCRLFLSLERQEITPEPSFTAVSPMDLSTTSSCRAYSPTGYLER
jgi:hypothetical protein